MGNPYPKLLEPAKIGSIDVRNRIYMPSMGLNQAINGYVSQKQLDYYEERAKGGVGMIAVEVSCVRAPEGINSECMLRSDDDEFIPGLANLAEVIHKHGAKCILQISHTGRGSRKKYTGMQPVGPSAIAMPYSTSIGYGGEVPRELTVDEITKIEQCYADAANRAKIAGFDGVLIHATGYYLVVQFLSSAANKRTDQYGGDITNRARFLLEIVSRIKKTAGEDFPILTKLSIAEFGPGGGITMEEGFAFASMLQNAGVKAIEVLAGSWGFNPNEVPTSGEAKGAMLPLTEALQKTLTIPVIAEHRLFYPDLAEEALESSKASFIGMGRGLISDPELPMKIASGKIDEIRPCIGCNKCIDMQLSFGKPAVCSSNAAINKLCSEYELSSADSVKEVWIAGGGVAGLEAARVAALRGHKVTLFEKGDKLGGQVNLAFVPPFKENIIPLIDYYKVQMERCNVDVKLNNALTSDMILEGKPDAVIIATGTSPASPPIQGIDLPIVKNVKRVLEGEDTSDNVVIIGGGEIGCETAEILLNTGRKVAIIEMMPALAEKMITAHKKLLLARLESLGAEVYTSTTCKCIKDSSVIIETEGAEKELKADTVLISTGDRPNNRLYLDLENKVKEIYQIGDSTGLKSILEAVNEGYLAGRKV